ncbi:MAG: hypothetical protein HYY93_08805 [Planctomycetes bacterium]|nr:hypothetical protein [Planctomycetota bacterium]
MDAGLRRRFGKIRVLLIDADGVLTDGAVYLGEGGQTLRRCHERDWTSLREMQQRGIDVLIWVSPEDALISDRARAAGLGTATMTPEERVALVHRAVARYGCGYDNLGVISADPADLPVIGLVGLACTVEGASPGVREAVDYVSTARGGEGAVREIAELIKSLSRRSRASREQSRNRA